MWSGVWDWIRNSPPQSDEMMTLVRANKSKLYGPDAKTIGERAGIHVHVYGMCVATHIIKAMPLSRYCMPSCICNVSRQLVCTVA